jgi:hypothetical protein
MRPKLHAHQFTPHADDAGSVKALSALHVRFGLTPRGRVWSVFAIRNFQDSHVDYLYGLPKLIEFNVLHFVGDSPSFTDFGFHFLCRHPNLQAVMCCNNNAITDRAAECVANSRRLRWVKLPRCGITDDGIALLAISRQILGLGLSGTSVTDACVPSLSLLINLRTLNIEDTAISRSATTGLQAALPRCKVVSNVAG